jgi:ABC-type Mn2+/Zn2+ transport system ATPase subunit
MTNIREPIIEFSRADLGYGAKIVLHDISFSVFPGEYFGLVGPNGAGKTTIVRAILGTVKPRAGSVRIAGSRGETPRFGYVPQRDTVDYVLPYTVEEIVMMGRYRQIGIVRRPSKADVEIVQESLAQVDIRALRSLAFNELSGGQKQRTLIARALASQPDILVLDEPTNGMDLSSRTAILGLIDQLHKGEERTIIMVSHLLDDVANHVERLAVVDQDLFQVGAVGDVLTGANLSAMYGMSVTVRSVDGRTVILAAGANGNR